MLLLRKTDWLSLTALALTSLTAGGAAFQGRISARWTRGGETLPVLYTVGSNSIRIEVTGSAYPHPINLFDRQSGALTMVYPHNRSFMRVQAPALQETSHNPAPGFPHPNSFSPPSPIAGQQFRQAAPNFPTPTNLPGPPNALPPGIGPGPINPPNFAPGASMPMMMPNMVPQEKVELIASTNKTIILGYPSTRYDATNRAERFEVWATDKLLPFFPYTQTGPARFGPRMLEDQWPDWLKSRGLFPLNASLRTENGPDRFHFEVLSIKAENIIDSEGKLFQPPAEYRETEPLPF